MLSSILRNRHRPILSYCCHCNSHREFISRRMADQEFKTVHSCSFWLRWLVLDHQKKPRPCSGTFLPQGIWMRTHLLSQTKSLNQKLCHCSASDSSSDEAPAPEHRRVLPIDPSRTDSSDYPQDGASALTQWLRAEDNVYLSRFRCTRVLFQELSTVLCLNDVPMRGVQCYYATLSASWCYPAQPVPRMCQRS